MATLTEGRGGDFWVWGLGVRGVSLPTAGAEPGRPRRGSCHLVGFLLLFRARLLEGSRRARGAAWPARGLGGSFQA